ncbi:SURF1 family protein [Acuticoccus sp. 2012]|uniref:SURF1-like protein n=1 Tax=Acuticoccus mangrovi TaxID=2796142 RepID=A0A934IMA7_9HYPH|nr:SURF1 family protein [Acuticoccus mangrovi]
MGARLSALACALVLCAVLVSLGVWQLERREWKRDLIARVDARIAAAPAAPPGPAEWPTLSDSEIEYKHVIMTGHFSDGDALVQAVTARGGGFWVVAPFVTDAGFTVLVNRGFVPADRRADPRPADETVVTGLVRISELGGGFLRSNRPEAGRWYSRDVPAIAETLGATDVAPSYFVDADARPGAPGALPIGGLTVVSFPNSHLVYALTWFALAAMALFAGGLVFVKGRAAEPDDPARRGRATPA